MLRPDDLIGAVSSREPFQLTSRDEDIRGEDQRQFGLDDVDGLARLRSVVAAQLQSQPVGTGPLLACVSYRMMVKRGVNYTNQLNDFTSRRYV